MKGFTFGSRDKGTSNEFYLESDAKDVDQRSAATAAATPTTATPVSTPTTSSCASSPEIKGDKVDKAIQTEPWNQLESTEIEINCLGLFVLACEYQIDQLKAQCCEYIKSKFKISSSNFDQVMSIATKYNSNELLEVLTKYQLNGRKNEDVVDGPGPLVDNPTNFCEDILKFIKEFGDVKLISKDERTIMCHSLFLRSRSSVFKRMLHLELNWKEGQRSEIFIHDFNGDVLESFVTFLITDTVDDMDKHAINLLLLAEKYSIAKLINQCTVYICSNISKFNLFDVIKAARKINSVKLANAVLDELEERNSASGGV